MVVADVRKREVARAAPAARSQPTAERGPDGEPPLLRTLALALSVIGFMIAFEIALAFTVAYLVTGRAY